MNGEGKASNPLGDAEDTTVPHSSTVTEKALYIGNIGRAPQRDIERLVDSYGRLRRVEMKSNYCFVYFDEATAATAGEEAIAALHGKRFGPQLRTLTVEWARGTAPRSAVRSSVSDGVSGMEGMSSDDAAEGVEHPKLPSKTLFVVNFDPDEITSRDLLIHFHRFGAIERIERRNHFAFVEFESLEDATKARMEMDGAYIGCRQVCVEFSQKKPQPASSESLASTSPSVSPPKALKLGRPRGSDEHRSRPLTRSVGDSSMMRRRRRSYSPPLFPGQQARRRARSRERVADGLRLESR
ncbi:hypothetical protein F1559_000138 [Cyanidiococcus yangmingshanensis]|uniref:RRM domain-containing protein n=1 Tax=Cyanidiococcus yangmingshanensis TaxID=2690220 RepID=A0A7J7IRU2_9RHOD|nr:hypothetical protein F1559_000138 [Cyanidiococcus yangmingshanensis]